MPEERRTAPSTAGSSTLLRAERYAYLKEWKDDVVYSLLDFSPQHPKFFDLSSELDWVSRAITENEERTHWHGIPEKQWDMDRATCREFVEQTKAAHWTNEELLDHTLYYLAQSTNVMATDVRDRTGTYDKVFINIMVPELIARLTKHCEPHHHYLCEAMEGPVNQHHLRGCHDLCTMMMDRAPDTPEETEPPALAWNSFMLRDHTAPRTGSNLGSADDEDQFWDQGPITDEEASGAVESPIEALFAEPPLDLLRDDD